MNNVSGSGNVSPINRRFRVRLNKLDVFIDETVNADTARPRRDVLSPLDDFCRQLVPADHSVAVQTFAVVIDVFKSTDNRVRIMLQERLRRGVDFKSRKVNVRWRVESVDKARSAGVQRRELKRLRLNGNVKRIDDRRANLVDCE